MTIERDIPNTNEIVSYMHCSKCIAEKPANVSPAEWSRTQAGWTELGLQVWCNRHNCNIVHIDFETVQHPANITACRPLETIQ